MVSCNRAGNAVWRPPSGKRKTKDVKSKFIRDYAVLLTVAFAAIASDACSKPQPVTNQASSSPPGQSQSAPTPQQSDFERGLDFIRKGRFTHVYVFARKDGGALNKDDGDVIRANVKIVDLVATDQGRRAIVGTNFDLTPENMNALLKRFNVEDYSGK